MEPVSKSTAEFSPKIRVADVKRLHLDWQVMLQAGQSKAVDMFLNFPVMDMNRNAIWKDPDKARASGPERMNSFWGDDSWKQAAYAESVQGGLFGRDTVKQSNQQIVAAFRRRLKEVAGFAFVPEPLPMKNSTNAIVYYLFLASQKSVAEKIINDIFKKYR